MFRYQVVFLAALVMAATLNAQDSRARVQGLVTDSSGAVVAGANVTLLNDETGVTSTQQTSQVGQYLFDLVLPGNYTVSVELSGFRKFVQRNVLVQSRGDVTVDARLEIGSATESVTVEAAPVAVQFNSSTMALTLNTKMANDLPIIHRNPFLLVTLNPATTLRSTTEQSPFHHWAATQFDVGGNTSTKNDILLDGAPSMASEKSSYTPSMDAVQEVHIQQNSVDAEFGHSAGGVLTVQMKSGTNAWHGTAYYLGRNPALNAVADHITRRANLTRNHVWGGTTGNPIIKNKLFNFVSYEAWRTMEPRSLAMTLPTAAERRGDFSQSRNINGGQRTIYDPFSTVVNNGVVTRTPFPNNIIPQSQIDPVAARMMQDIWQPNLPGDDITGANNFRAGFAERIKYWNFSDRVDWNASEKLTVFGRFSMFKTFVAQDNFANSPALQVTGSERHSWSTVGDVVYSLNPSTVLNLRGSWNRIFDSYAVADAQLKESDLAALWPSQWYQPYLSNLPAIYYPGLTVRQGPANNVFGRSGYWYQDPEGYSVQGKISKNAGKHYIKTGGEYRAQRVIASRPRWMNFDFSPNHTANTFLNPDTRVTGDGWATFLLGVLDQNSNIATVPLQKPRVDYWGLFIHDDWKITQRLTLNIGLRWEYETPMVDPEDRLSRYLDLTAPIPEFQGAGAPQIPANVLALRRTPLQWTGAWIFADSENRNSWNAQKNLFLPRFGLAYRLDNKTALRFGYARYVVPGSLTDGLDILGSVFYPGFDATTTAIGAINGVPQQRLSNPFPGGLVQAAGKNFGTYTNLGGAASFYNQNFRVGKNDRFNVTVERQLPWSFVGTATYFHNRGFDHPISRDGGNYFVDLNAVDPRYGYEYKTAVTQGVPNPFRNLLPENKMPGQLRTQATVTVNDLLRPYPQYGQIRQALTPGSDSRYHSLQLQLQRPFVNGFNMLFGYNFNRARQTQIYDELDLFLQNLTWQQIPDPRHRFTSAAIYQLPFGRGQRMLTNAHPIADAVLGGWALSGIFTFNTGEYLRFDGLLQTGDPVLSDRSKGRMFNTDAFRVLPAFTRRENPLYPGVTGPNFKNLDLTLSKNFKVTEALGFELRMEAYNAFNGFNGANPVTNVNSSQFGAIVAQRAGYFGRQFQYSGRLRW
jgi:hypothetical protein